MSYPLPESVRPFLTGGVAFDLSSGWWPGMPSAPANPPFEVTTYRTPHGMHLEAGDPADTAQASGFVIESIRTSAHTGTHIDAACHVTVGPADRWHGGYSAEKYLGDFGALRDDASALPPFITRGVLLDIPAAAGTAALRDGQPVDGNLLEAAADREHVRLRDGDAILIRTGMMCEWPDKPRMERGIQPGLSLDGAEWITGQARPVIVGADNMSVEVAPSTEPGELQPVHRYLLHDNGIHLLEWVALEELAAAGVHEFLLICLPLTIRGATGSLVRPIAIANSL